MSRVYALDVCGNCIECCDYEDYNGEWDIVQERWKTIWKCEHLKNKGKVVDCQSLDPDCPLPQGDFVIGEKEKNWIMHQLSKFAKNNPYRLIIKKEQEIERFYIDYANKMFRSIQEVEK